MRKTLLTTLLLLCLYMASLPLAAQSPMTGYLFAYFTSNTTEGQQLRLALSRNGLDYEPLCGGQPVANAKDAVYYAYANADFTGLDGDPQPLFAYKAPTIDTDIVRDEHGKYHLFFNTRGGSEGLVRKQYMFTALHSPETWTLVPGRMQPNSLASEGSCVFPLIDGTGWILMYDCFKDGKYQFCKTTDWQHFEPVRETKTKGVFTPRHGTAIQITEEEYQRLKNYYK